MPESKHFKPPYQLGTVEDVPDERYYVIGGEWTIFARIPAIDRRMRDTAEFLVRAANAHDDLLAALTIIAELEDDCENQKFMLTRFQASQIARAAIAKAEGRANK